MSDQLKDGIFNGFIDATKEANIDYVPSLIINEPDEGIKVLTEIEKELDKCIEFKFCVAFLNMTGVTVLLPALTKLKQKGIKGTMIVSQYQNFTEPKALRKILEFDNIELRIVPTSIFDTKINMHSKGYIFNLGNDEYSIIVGSSNMTQSALLQNKEWNVKLNSLNEGSYAKMVLKKFDEMYQNSVKVTTEWINEYEKEYKEQKALIILDDTVVKLSEIKPNSMQIKAIKEIDEIRKKGGDRALAISSTGTGKTILCALDVKQYKPKKMLFVVHRENILRAAERTFKMVLGKDIKTCIFGGGNIGDISNSNYVFAMVQTLSKDNNLESFSKDEFDYIVFDEAHHLGAKSTKKIFDYFKPKFILGMTATPERMDGFDIYKLFDYKIACEIRLNDAMKEDLICPFHYFGVTDITVDGKLIDEETPFSKLTSDERVRHILDKINYYGYSGDKVKGLIFVSTKEEAKALSEEFNKRGYKTVALTGNDSEARREECIRKLESDDEKDCLDYIFTIDIFNEGIDIQKVNQIVMIRPTQSAIIFVQQLGRGLRKNKDKEYLVVIDFIGNYKSSFLIPIALSGDRSYNKDNLRRFIKGGKKTIYGPSTIDFEKIVEDRIFKNLDNANFNDAKLIKQAYTELKNKIGRIPELTDFEKYGSIDVLRIIDKFDSYQNFLMNFDKDYQKKFSVEELKYFKLVSRKYGNSKKVLETEFLKLLIDNTDLTYDELEKMFISKINEDYPNIILDKNALTNVKNQMDGSYFISSEKKDYEKTHFITNNKIDRIFFNCIDDNDFEDELRKLLDFIIDNHKKQYSDYSDGTLLCLNKKYTYDDAVRCLNFVKNMVPTNIGGYVYDKITNTLPIFVNYDKDENINDSIKYEDKFLSRDTISWISKNKRTIDSSDVRNVIDADKNKTTILLFVRKNKDDNISKEFYFLGKVHPTNDYKNIEMKSGYKAVQVILKLDNPVREELYDYLINN